MTNTLSSQYSSFILFKLRTVEVLILLAVLASLVFVNTCAADSTPPSLIILPPANKTGSPTLDWLAAGIQDTMNVDLWGISGARTRAITEYGNLAGYNVQRMASLDAEAAVKLAQEAKVDLVWRGEYTLNDKDIILTYWALDSKNGSMLHKQEINGPLDDAVTIISRMATSLLSPSGIPATKQEIDRISKPATGSFNAFEQNSLGFGKQLQRSANRGSMKFDKRGWIEHCQKAVALDPEYAEAYVNLGWALHSDGSSEAAFTAFSAAVRLKPYLLDGWMGLGYIHRDRGDNGMALDAFQKAMAINSHLVWPREELKKVIALTSPNAQQFVVMPQKSTTGPSLQMFESTLSADERRLFVLAGHESLDIRMGAIKSLARSRKVQALPFLKQMINKPDQAFEVLKLIANTDMTEATPYLIEALEKRIAPDESRLSGLTEQNILGVVQLINRRSLHQAIPVLVRTLGDSSPAVRERAALTLGDLGKQEAVESLLKLVAIEQNHQVRISALVALVKLGDVESRETMKTIFSEGKDMEVINYATKLMKQRNIRISGQ